MSDSELPALYAALLAAPFPRLAHPELDFLPVYDADISGFASRAIAGETIDASLLPEPDDDVSDLVGRLRNAAHRSGPEEEFLRYFDLLERVKRAVPLHRG